MMKKIVFRLLACLLLICLPTSCATTAQTGEVSVDPTAQTGEVRVDPTAQTGEVSVDSTAQTTHQNSEAVEFDMSDIITSNSLDDFLAQLDLNTTASVVTNRLLQSVSNENLLLNAYDFKSITYRKSKDENGTYTGYESMEYYWHPKKCSDCAQGLSCYKETHLELRYSSEALNQESINRGFISTTTEGLYQEDATSGYRIYIFWINPQTYCRFHINLDNPSIDEIATQLIAFCQDTKSAWNEHEIQ